MTIQVITQLAPFTCTDGTTLQVSLRLSKRAQRWRITLNNQGVLELVFPERQGRKLLADASKGSFERLGQTVLTSQTDKTGQFNQSDQHQSDQYPNLQQITNHLEQHRKWIEQAAKQTRAQREAYQESKAAGLPSHLHFAAIGEIWLIEYKQTQAAGVTARKVPGQYTLRLSGAIDDQALCCRALQRFTIKQAKATLPQFAWNIANLVGANPRSIEVNNRKSAWGICTRSGDIKIDRRVIFFPADMARQIVLHELAHLKQHNHSKLFYEELFSLQGSSKEAEKAVKQGIRFVPAWFIDVSKS